MTTPKTKKKNLLDFVVPLADVAKFNLAIRTALDEHQDTIIPGRGGELVGNTGRLDAVAKGYRVTIQLSDDEMARVKSHIARLALSTGTKIQEYNEPDRTKVDETKILADAKMRKRVRPDD